MKIYTRTGDTGMTGLFGGRRVGKDSARIEAYGTVDELNAQLGVARALSEDAELAQRITALQNDLFVLGADLATPIDMEKTSVKRIEQRHIDRIETAIDDIEEKLDPIRYFILPGGHAAAAQLHACRTICRRAERCIVHLAALEEVSDTNVRFINRLSDYLFVLARYANKLRGQDDIRWMQED
ncbi:MAG: cob(I)yrinic acid a,c-diamide adenosyltransferase [Bacteroidia bacterium]|nr:cob(I)yrinic acid a,c-diamide adenosyltransferase [Bacteroidia bacterium]